MNLQEYISTGILEAYILGDLSSAERMEIESMMSKHPELREELRKAEQTMEAIAMKGAIKPRPNVKQSLMVKIEQGGREANVVPISTAPWKYAAAASIAIALVASYLAFSYRERWLNNETALSQLIAQNQQMTNEYNVVNQKLDKIQNDLSIIESIAFEKVVMKGTSNDQNALASVYWNSTTHEAYLSVQNLKEITRENQFQLWAIVKGKPVDVGVFDKGFNGLLKMKNVEGAAAFAITIEPRGGLSSPTLETMQVIGAMPRAKS